MKYNGYFTKKELKQFESIDTFNIEQSLKFLRDRWYLADWGYKLKGKKVLRLELHTAGWSGNEEIIRALQKSLFWTFYWQKTYRGGHYYFKINLFNGVKK